MREEGPGGVDVHCHFALPGRTGGPLGPWSVEAALAFAADHGIAVSMLSLPSTGVPRQANDLGAALVAAHPGHFGLLASVPLDGAGEGRRELGRALDELGADGVAITTHGAGRYLGDPLHDDLLADLDRRAATVFVHPQGPLDADHLTCGRPGPVLEYPFDTARAVVNMVFARVGQRFPAIRFIVAHAGGPLAALADRVATVGTLPWVPNPSGVTSEEVVEQLGALYYDTALAGSPHMLRPVLEVTSPDHLVLGTDYPPATVPLIEANLAGLRAFDGLSPVQRQDVATNATTLFPRIAEVLYQRNAEPALFP